MIKITDFEIEVTYKVALGSFDMPDDVYGQLIEARDTQGFINGNNVHQFPEAAEWLNDNIKEADATDLEWVVNEIETL